MSASPFTRAVLVAVVALRGGDVRGRARRGVALLGLALLGLCLATAAPASAAGEGDLKVDAVDSSSYPNVSLTVTWPSRPSDTGAVSVSVQENGEQRVARLTPLQRQGLAVAILMDTSGSMSGAPLDAAKAAAGTMVTRLPQDTKVAVIGFSETARLATPLTADRAAIANGLSGLTAGGGTALYDAVGLALDQLPAGAATRRQVVLLSDGGDNSSSSKIDAALARISAAGVGVNVVELVTPDTDHASLDRLAKAGGGTVISAADPAGLAAAYDTLGRGLASQYRIDFQATGHGTTPVHVSLVQGSHSVAADLNLDLPAVPVTAAPTTTAAAAVEAPAANSQSIWPLVVGGSLCFAALLIFMTSVRRPRRNVPLGADLAVAPSSASSVVSRLAEQATVATDRALERHGRRSRLNNALDRAGILLRPGEFVLLVGSGAVVGIGVGTLLANAFLGLLLAVLVLISARLVLGVLTARRRRRFIAQLGDNLQLMAGTLRSGYGVLQAMDVVAQEAEAPSRDEFRRVVVEARLGRDVNESLRSSAERVGSEDFTWVSQAIEINREVGGDLAVVLDNVAATIRERERVRRQVKALSAEGRMSAYVLVALPIGMAGLLAVINPGYVSELTRGPGLVLSAIGVVMLAIGSFWLSRMVKVEY